jgi:carbonic anhydrase
MPSSSDAASLNTALIAGMAAALATLLVLQWKSKNDEYDRYNQQQQQQSRHSHYYYQGGNGSSGGGMDPTSSSSGGQRSGSTSHPTTDHPYSTDLDGMEGGVVGRDSGWSMAEALAAAKLESNKREAMLPAEVLRSLQRGNSRFWSGNASRPERSAFERRQLISQQFPLTAVLGCADSRVPTEIIFDQGLGDMFVVRVAGNVLGETTEGSLDYAVHHLQVKILVILGHEGCGAIKAAGLPMEVIDLEPPALAATLKGIKAGLNQDHISSILDRRARDREAVCTNVKNQVVKLSEDVQILDKVNEGKLKIVGAFYEISSGIVDFFMQVAKYDPVEHGEFKPSPGVQSRYDPVTKKIVFA